MTTKPRFKVGDRVTYGREGRSGEVVKVRSVGEPPWRSWRYDVKTDFATVGGYWQHDLELAR